MKAKSSNFLVLLFMLKSILHISCKKDVEFEPKTSQISCLVISSGKFSIYFFLIVIFCSGLWWCVWMGCNISYSCEEQGRAKGGSCCSCETNCFVLWEFSLRVLDSKEELDWFKVLECWLLDLAARLCVKNRTLALDEFLDFFIVRTKVFL